VEDMSLKGMLASKWFVRIVLVSWIICAASIIVVFKNMELIVHGQLYDYGLIFSPEWADGYRVLTWMIFIFAGVPMALSAIAIASSFLIDVEPPEREKIVPQRAGSPRGITKTNFPQVRPIQRTRQVQQPVRESVKRTDNGDCVGISCPECKKMFGKALVMLDFRSGSNRLVSVCPYCNAVLGYTRSEQRKNEGFYVDKPDKKIVQ
jgi:hypothetical protein